MYTESKEWNKCAEKYPLQFPISIGIYKQF